MSPPLIAWLLFMLGIILGLGFGLTVIAFTRRDEDREAADPDKEEVPPGFSGGRRPAVPVERRVVGP